jgi:hypothetical protein
MKKLHIFFSFYYEDREYYYKLREKLEERDYFDFSVAEIPENLAENEEYIKTLIRPKINWASVLIVIVSPGAYTRNWINWEIEYAIILN